MTNKFRIGAAGVTLVAALGMTSAANAADTATATAEAEILSALTLTAVDILDFGQVAVNGAGAVRVAADTATAPSACSANLVCIGATSAASFSVEGSADQNVDITLPNNANLYLGGDITKTLASEILVLNQIVSSEVGDVAALDTAGDGSFLVGGRLVFDGTEVAGNYSGTFNVSVEYQ